MITPAGHEGMTSSAQHAEDDAPGWGERAYQAVIAHMKWDCDWTVDEARTWLYSWGLDEPAEERAWGAVTRRLLRDGVIVRVGSLPVASSHGNWKPTYRIV